jgi:1-acyl-sn-glycerol-3-phosphate acyltransferase
LFCLALVIDLVRAVSTAKPFMSLRLVAFLCVYLSAEVVGLLWLGAQWLRYAGHVPVDDTTRLQSTWCHWLMTSVRLLFRLDIAEEGLDDAVPGPVVVLVRHVSIIDTLLPTTLLTRARGLRLRFVLKSELLLDPCLDIAGHRLPNCFVRRRGASAVEGAGTEERDELQQLARGMSSNDGALIFPEGTRFTPRKRARALQQLERVAPHLAALASTWTHTLPPKPAGTRALLQGAISADMVFFAHDGLQGFASVKDIWSGALLGRTLRVKAWRVTRGDVPLDDDAFSKFLYEQWAKVEAFAASSPLSTSR